jgi:antitoxin component of RelBE/YafQ-DinJ toxin-antitoxin module
MNNRTLTIRVADDLVAAAQGRADRLGISLSLVLRNELHRFANGGDVLISSFQPNTNLRRRFLRPKKSMRPANWKRLTRPKPRWRTLKEYADSHAG